MKNTILPAAWNIPDKVKGNCYVFSLGPKQARGGYTNRTYKARPGDKCENKKCCYKNKEFDFSSCEKFASRILCDNPKHVSKLPANVAQSIELPIGYHMFCAMLSPKGSQDFHFARRFFLTDLAKSDTKKLLERSPEPARTQFSKLLKKKGKNYIWLHQRGWMAGGPILHDASNALITNIKKCDMKYDTLDYNVFCSFFKVKTRKASVTRADEH